MWWNAFLYFGSAPKQLKNSMIRVTSTSQFAKRSAIRIFRIARSFLVPPLLSKSPINKWVSHCAKYSQSIIIAFSTLMDRSTSPVFWIQFKYFIAIPNVIDREELILDVSESRSLILRSLVIGKYSRGQYHGNTIRLECYGFLIEFIFCWYKSDLFAWLCRLR